MRSTLGKRTTHGNQLVTLCTQIGISANRRLSHSDAVNWRSFLCIRAISGGVSASLFPSWFFAVRCPSASSCPVFSRLFPLVLFAPLPLLHTPWSPLLDISYFFS